MLEIRFVEKNIMRLGKRSQGEDGARFHCFGLKDRDSEPCDSREFGAVKVGRAHKRGARKINISFKSGLCEASVLFERSRVKVGFTKKSSVTKVRSLNEVGFFEVGVLLKYCLTE